MNFQIPEFATASSIKKIVALSLFTFYGLLADAQLNTSYGSGALPQTLPYGNAAFGYNAMQNVTNSNTNGNNTAIGSLTLRSVTGNDNTAVGAQSLYSTTTGNANTAVGEAAMFDNTTGINNTAIGYLALANGTTAKYNTGIGSQALYNNLTGELNSGFGMNTLYSNTFGGLNTAVGTNALFSNTIGGYNTAVGVDALNYSTEGGYNTSSGAYSLFNNTTGDDNTAMGYQTLNTNKTGNANSAFGREALFNAIGSDNTAIGYRAGYNNIGNDNLFIGREAGALETGSHKLYISGYVNNSNKTIIYGDLSTGQILMGRSNPTGYVFKGTRTLNILGGIIADSMRVALSSNWADYVFDKEYKLMPLEELKNYVEVNKHLPNIPSAEEVKTEGIQVADMNVKLLEKIEELHLYVLQQQEQIKEQQKEINELKLMVGNKNTGNK